MRVSPNVLLRTTGSVHRETSALTRVMTRSLSARRHRNRLAGEELQLPPRLAQRGQRRLAMRTRGLMGRVGRVCVLGNLIHQ